MNYVIIGAGSFIGSTLVEQLISLSNVDRVIGIDTYFPDKDFMKDDKKFIRLQYSGRYEFIDINTELRNYYTSINELEPADRSIDGVFVLGAKSSSPDYKGEQIVHSYRYTTKAMLVAMQIAYEYKCPIVYASTSSVYGPSTGYTAVFRAREEMAKGWSKETGLSTIGCRFYSVYGERERFKNPKYRNMVTQMLDCVTENKPVIIYGDGHQTRDFIHVNDIVDGLICSMVTAQRIKITDVVNLGTGISYSFNDVIDIIKRRFNIDVRYIENPLGDSYVQNTQAKGSQLLHTRDVINWTALTDFFDGFNALMDYYEAEVWKESE